MKSAGNTPFLKILIIVFEYQQVLSTGFTTLGIDTVRNERMHSKNNPSAQLIYNIPMMLREIISSRFYESDYKNITQKLLYENISYDDAVERGIAIVAESDVFEYKKV